MKIETIEIKNWRTIDYMKVDFHDITSDKTEFQKCKADVLSSLLFFFGNLIPELKDFQNPECEMSVKVTFTELNLIDKVEFGKYLNKDGKVTLVKSAIANQTDFDIKPEKETRYWNKNDTFNNARIS